MKVQSLHSRYKSTAKSPIGWGEAGAHMNSEGDIWTAFTTISEPQFKIYGSFSEHGRVLFSLTLSVNSQGKCQMYLQTILVNVEYEDFKVRHSGCAQ